MVKHTLVHSKFEIKDIGKTALSCHITHYIAMIDRYLFF